MLWRAPAGLNHESDPRYVTVAGAKSGIPITLENPSPLQEQRIALTRRLPELSGSPLIGKLYCAERRFVPIHKDRLDIAAIDGGIGLEEGAEK